MVVLHYTAMRNAAAALARLCDPVAEVSAHYLIAEDGTVHAIVPEEARAWHAGAGSWGGLEDINSRSIGVELANDGHTPFSHPLMASLEALLPGIMQRWRIPPERVIAHSDMAPLRKEDPGGRFDWRRLARQGLSVWPDRCPDLPADPQRFRAAALGFGYPDAPDAALLAAFRLRFRPFAKGPLCGADVAQIADLAHRFPAAQALPLTAPAGLPN